MLIESLHSKHLVHTAVDAVKRAKLVAELVHGQNQDRGCHRMKPEQLPMMPQNKISQMVEVSVALQDSRTHMRQSLLEIS